MDAPNPINRHREAIKIDPPPPPQSLTELQRLPQAFANPFGEVLQRLVDFAQHGSIELEQLRKLQEQMVKMEMERVPALGFATRRIFYAPADGVVVVDISELQRNTPTAFSLTTLPNGTGDGSPIAETIYGAFGRSLVTDAGAPPTNFDFLLKVGDKIQKYTIRQGLEAFALWSRTPFIGILYTTTGRKEELPDL